MLELEIKTFEHRLLFHFNCVMEASEVLKIISKGESNRL